MSEREKLFPEHINNAIVLRVSREQILANGLDDHTPEELAEHNAKMAAFHESQRRDRSAMLNALDLLGMSGDVTLAMLKLHSCDTDADWSAECQGCDVSGYEGEQPAWPCRTVLALAEHHGIDMPDKELPGKHYDGEFVPSDGKRWQMPAMTSFAEALGKRLDAETFHGMENPK